MEIENNLFPSLREDAHKLERIYGLPSTIFTEEEEDGEEEMYKKLENVYGRVLVTIRRKVNYPVLYLWAWSLLIDSLRKKDMITLREIGVIYTRFSIELNEEEEILKGISIWHLKSILYCWVYLPMNGSLAIEDRRSNLNAKELILTVIECGAFLNLLPDEAEKKLIASRLSSNTVTTLKPYLFRLSTSYPGIITLTYRLPISDRTVHQRIQELVPIISLIENPNGIYRVFFMKLIDQLQRKEGKLVDATEFANLFKERLIDPGLNIKQFLEIHSLVERKLKGKKIILNQESFLIMHELFLSHLEERLIVPDIVNGLERIGLTTNYLHSYRENSINRRTCLQCGLENLQEIRKEVTSNRIYCSELCNELDFLKCY